MFPLPISVYSQIIQLTENILPITIGNAMASTYPVYFLRKENLVKVFIFSFTCTIWSSRRFSWPSYGKEKQVLIPLSGRLGNQLFQVAFSVAGQRIGFPNANVQFLKNNYSTETDLSKSLLKSVPHIYSDQHFCSLPKGGPVPVFEEQRYVCDDLEHDWLQEGCVVIRGLWQCLTYAKEGGKFISETVSKSTLKGLAVRRVRKFRSGSRASLVVAIHIRRGDYTKRFNKGLLEPLPMSYYFKGIVHLPRESIFLIFSDDPIWCKKEIVRSKFPSRKYKIIEEKDQILSFLMMIQADMFIIANSTFSWWAAVLGESKRKVVIAPRQWFGSRVKGFNTTRFYPKEWKLM